MTFCPHVIETRFTQVCYVLPEREISVHVTPSSLTASESGTAVPQG